MQQISLGKTLDVELVERELASLWQTSGGAAKKGVPEKTQEEETPVLRARAANLIVFVTEPHELDEVHELLPDLSAAHPSRVLTMFADTKADDRDIEMYVAAYSQEERGTRRLCCEAVTLNAQGKFVDELPSATLPLLASDLPTFLWWRADVDAHARILSNLLPAVDRLIVDSVEFAKSAAELLAVSEIYKVDPELGISDLNWARLTSWRGLLADYYDVTAYREALERIDAVEIDYVAPQNDPGAIAPQALLMTGWLASRLGWMFNAAGDHNRFSFTSRNQQRISITLTAINEATVRPGRLGRVELKCGNASFKVERSADRQLVITEARLGQSAQRGRVLPVRNRSTTQLLSREMEILCNDQIYQEALAVVSNLIQ